MKRKSILGFAVALFSASRLLVAQDAAQYEMPQPTAEHQWLQQFVGEWETETDVTGMPDHPPMKGKGTETVRSIGGFWVIGEGTGSMEGVPGNMIGIITLGYDVSKQKYVGTWIDSMTGILWVYEGTVDAARKTLTLHSEGPCPFKPGLVKFKETVEFKSADHRVFTSSFQNDDGSWTQMLTVNHRRKK